MTNTRIKIRLRPQVPTEQRKLSWTPTGKQVQLEAMDGSLRGKFRIGDYPEIHLRLHMTAGTDGAILELDATGTAAFEETSSLTATGSRSRGKVWYSFQYCLELEQGDSHTRPYPISLWYVETPGDNEEAPPSLNWTILGWHQGEFVHCDGQSCAKAYVLIQDYGRDGSFDMEHDTWRLNTTEEILHENPQGLRFMKEFTWLKSQAYRVLELDRDGRFIIIESFDPGFTKEEDILKRDPTREDREAPRATKPITFKTDLKEALAIALAEGKRILIDFSATWCGPCSMMEELVFPSQAVANAGKNVIFVKIDEGENKELLNAYDVSVLPTLILMDRDGRAVRRADGYQSVKELVEFLK